MCLITVLPPGVVLSQEQVVDAMSKNPHGVGIMYSQDGQLYTGRSMSSNPTKIRRWLARAPSHLDRVVHFRKTTAGATSRANIHPFEVHGRFGLMHNGTLSDSIAETSKKDPRSDTAIFVEEVLEQMNPDTLLNTAVWKLVKVAADESRIVMLDGKTGEMYYTSDDLWTEGRNKIWLSNTYSIEKGEVWGVEKKTYYEFFGRGYSGYYRGSYGSYGNYGSYSGTSSPSPSPAPAPASNVVVIGEPRKVQAGATSYQRKEDTDEDVMKSIYMLHPPKGGKIPAAMHASGHRWYGKASKLHNEVVKMDDTGHMAPSTLIVAFLHAGCSDVDVMAMQADEAKRLVERLLAFVELSDTPGYDLTQNFKRRKQQKEQQHA